MKAWILVNLISQTFKIYAHWAYSFLPVVNNYAKIQIAWCLHEKHFIFDAWKPHKVDRYMQLIPILSHKHIVHHVNLLLIFSTWFRLDCLNIY